ncbi:MAG: hypothetical protein CVU47_01305 [Chloroflexi bacterium HGW-Chloroflexi-9]|nr:MAG: hypothetical protein CVU47_01305 [Chloroflexi bacterium HGW-Chloroflexi-9]
MPGRNDACPCASGAKYKKCCLPLERYFVPTTPPIAEHSFLAEVLEESPELRSFMGEERGRLSLPVRWFVDPTIAADTRARITSIPGVVHQVRFHESPTDPVDVAHELAHALVEVDGVALVGALRADLDDFSAALSGIPAHPRVHAYLHKHGFDLSRVYEQEVEGDLAKLRRVASEPSDHFTVAIWTLNYAKMRLMHRQVAELTAHDGVDRYDDFFAARFPNVHREAVETLAEIDRYDLTDIDEQARLLKALKERCKLPEDGLVVLRTPVVWPLNG